MEIPGYYKLHSDLWQGVNDALPPAQAMKVLYALEGLFFEGKEPDLEKMPKAARGIYNTHRQLVLGYRKNALNGGRNRGASKKATPKHTPKPTPKHGQEHTQKTTQVFEGSDEGLPAETQNLGYKQNPTFASNNTKQETINNIPVASAPHSAERCGCVSQPHKKNSDNLSALTEAIAGRDADAPRWRVAAPPTLEDYQQVSRKLEQEGIDALTEHDREIYHAGHAAYAASA